VQTSQGAGWHFADWGSRSRFWNMFMFYRMNTGKEITPSIIELHPLTGELVYATTLANIIRDAAQRGAAPGSNIYGLTLLDYETEGGKPKFTKRETLEVDKEAYRTVFRKESNVLLHLMEQQSKMMTYTGINPYAELFGWRHLAQTSLGRLPFVRRLLPQQVDETRETAGQYLPHIYETTGYRWDDLEMSAAARRYRWNREEYDRAHSPLDEEDAYSRAVERQRQRSVMEDELLHMASPFIKQYEKTMGDPYRKRSVTYYGMMRFANWLGSEFGLGDKFTSAMRHELGSRNRADKNAFISMRTLQKAWDYIDVEGNSVDYY
jgi:hypothetical protein